MAGTWRWPKLNQAGDRVAAENYYQHAEHYFRLMCSDTVAT